MKLLGGRLAPALTARPISTPRGPIVERPIRIENRAQLVYLLTEAAELEHGIMCCYLFGAFTMKESTAEGLTDDQMAAMKRWRQELLDISVQEMLHLALVCNILTAVGGAPMLRRPNL